MGCRLAVLGLIELGLIELGSIGTDADLAVVGMRVCSAGVSSTTLTPPLTGRILGGSNFVNKLKLLATR
jgi:hypothetical protein